MHIVPRYCIQGESKHEYDIRQMKIDKQNILKRNLQKYQYLYPMLAKDNDCHQKILSKKLTNFRK